MRDAESLPLTELAAALRLEQRRCWQYQKRILVEEYLKRHPILHQDESLVVDLIYHEYLLREEQGEQPQKEEYLQRFPTHAETLAAQIDLHTGLAQDPLLTQALPTETNTLPPDLVSASTGIPRIPGYEVFEELGRGGMGVVYRGRQTALDRQVALKMILSGEFAGTEERKRFQTEALAVARLSHPNVVQVYDIGEQEGRPFFSMEYVDGGSLSQKSGTAPWSAHDAARMIETLARTVHATHEKGVVHRDLKPANILLSTDGTPKITDFGLAKLNTTTTHTQTGAIVGTPSYMAPEQAEGKSTAISPATDVWALGAILYELLTTRPPFTATSALDTLMKVLSEDVIRPRKINPKVPRDLDIICLKCLQKDPSQRYLRAADLADDLRLFLAGEPIRARVRRPWVRLPKNRWLTVSLILGTIFLVGISFRIYQVIDYQHSMVIKHAIDEAHRLRYEHNWPATATAFTEVIRLKPAYAEAYSHRGWAYYQMGQIDRAMEDYEESIRRDPAGAWGYRGRGYIRLVKEQYAQALDDLNMAIPIHPKDSTLRLYRAQANLNLHHYTETLADVAEALKIQESGFGYRLACTAHIGLKQWRLAVGDVNHAMRVDSAHHPIYSTWLTEGIAALLEKDQSRYEKVRDRLLNYAKFESGTNVGVHAARLGAVSELPTEYGLLERYAEKGVKAVPKSGYNHHILGLVQLRAGKLESASKSFETALQCLWKSRQLNHLGLALVQVQSGDKVKAKSSLAEAIRGGLPVDFHPHDALEYQLLLAEAQRKLANATSK